MKYTLLFLVVFLPLSVSAQVDQSVPKYIAETAAQYGVDPQLALYISWQESHWNTEAMGDHGTSWGVWQIHNPKEKGLNINQAKDLQFSTNWSMKTMLEDKSCRQWSTCPRPLVSI